MDTEKIIDNIINQSNVNDMKNELINLKGYLNTIDVKITSLSNECEKKENELTNIDNEIVNLKEKILADCNNKYEQKLKELVDDKIAKSQIFLALSTSYEKYIKKTIYNQISANMMKEEKNNAEKEYEESILKENEYKEEYKTDIEDFNSFVNYYLENENYVFEKENNEFEIFCSLEYFDAHLLNGLINLLVIRERLIMEREQIKNELLSNKEEKINVTNKIEELDLKVTTLLKERKQYIDDIQDKVGKTFEVVEKGIKDSAKVKNVAREILKDSISNIVLDDKKDSQEEAIGDVVNTVISQGKKRLKSFFNDKKDN